MRAYIYMVICPQEKVWPTRTKSLYYNLPKNFFLFVPLTSHPQNLYGGWSNLLGQKKKKKKKKHPSVGCVYP